jgi:protein gp37
MSRTKIEWADESWNPVTGCTEVSPGCDRCYARTFAERWRDVAGHPYEQGFDLRLWPERLALPLHWRKPRRIFVNSMSDLFHRDVPDAFILDVARTMLRANWHTYQVLTKRADRLLRLVPLLSAVLGDVWPAHIWVGVTVETNAYAWRADKLRGVPSPVRFISYEPALGPIDLVDLAGISWLIAGGESGHGARPAHPAWFRDVRDRCAAQGIAFFLKQWGLWCPGEFQRAGTFAGYWQFQQGSSFHEAAHGVPEDQYFQGPPSGDYRTRPILRLPEYPDLAWIKLGKVWSGHRLDAKEHRAFPVVEVVPCT